MKYKTRNNIKQLLNLFFFLTFYRTVMANKRYKVFGNCLTAYQPFGVGKHCKHGS